VKGTYFQALEKIFETLNEWKEDKDKEHFFINKTGEIYLISEIEIENNFILNTNINSIDINDEWETELLLSNIPLNIQVWEKIVLSNIRQNLNLDWKRIYELAFGLRSIKINVWKIRNYSKIIEEWQENLNDLWPLDVGDWELADNDWNIIIFHTGVYG
jgi:translation elongation factor EF-1beta